MPPGELSWEAERDHLKARAPIAAPPPSGFRRVRIYVHAPSSAALVLQRATEVLACVIRPPSESWPSQDDWQRLLPSWFVAACLPATSALPAEVAGVEVERWTVDGFTYWFEPAQREWWWWDAELVSADDLIIRVAVTELQFPHQALEWLLWAAGATLVEDELVRELSQRSAPRSPT